MTGCYGSIFPSAQDLFGVYLSPSYALCRVKSINVCDIMRNKLETIKFDILSLMNEPSIKGGDYSSNDIGMTFEVVNQGESYIICQGSDGVYGNVLDCDPEMVLTDVREDLLSHEAAMNIYRVVYDSAHWLLTTKQHRPDVMPSVKRVLHVVIYLILLMKTR